MRLCAAFSVRPGERIGVAVSGGADSVALLRLLLEACDKLGVTLHVVHFNHKLRGRSSDTDERFVASLAKKYGLPFHSGNADIAGKAKREKTNLEDVARRARYAFFEQLVAEGKLDQIAVAHTADDQAETVLAHILRGTGLAGLSAIHPAVGSVVRPLLSFRRAELRAYLKSIGQIWREDATNRDTTRTRARIRKKLLPLLEKQFQPRAVEHLCELAERAREHFDFIHQLSADIFPGLVQPVADGCMISAKNLLEPLKSEHPKKMLSLSKQLIFDIVSRVKKRSGQMDSQHADSVLKFARSGENGKTLALPGGVFVRRENDNLVFSAKNSSVASVPLEFEYHIDFPLGNSAVRIPELGCVFRFRVIDWASNRGETIFSGAVFDRDRLRQPLVLRNWRPGDRFRPAGRRSAHKLKRLFNQKRISRWQRQGWPVLTSGGVLAWARGFPAAAEFAADERTRAGIVIVEDAL